MSDDYQEHQVIWLQPWCAVCEGSAADRQWCQDNVWDDCDECGAKPVRYIIDPRKRSATAASQPVRPTPPTQRGGWPWSGSLPVLLLAACTIAGERKGVQHDFGIVTLREMTAGFADGGLCIFSWPSMKPPPERSVAPERMAA